MKNVILAVMLLTTITLSAQVFQDKSVELGIEHSYVDIGLMGGGAAFFDYDNDGDEDLYVTGGQRQDKLYLNNSDGTFSQVLRDIGLGITNWYNTMGVSTGDIDNDGRREILVTTFKSNSEVDYAPNLLFRIKADGTLEEFGQQAGLTGRAYSHGATFFDFDKDGFLDIYIANHLKEVHFTFDENGIINGYAHECFPDFLYHNNGNGTFTDVSNSWLQANEGCGLAVVASDYDLDTDSDIYVANDFGGFVVPNVLYNNQFPAEMFTDLGAETGANVGMFGMGIAVGDYDQDLDIDYYITNVGRNVLLENQRDTFLDVTTQAGVENAKVPGEDLNTTGWATAFMDVNNDGLLDLWVINGRIPMLPQFATAQDDPDKLFLNNGDKTFTDITDQCGIGDEQINRGMAYSDFDKDGDLDVFTVAIQEGQSRFWVNELDSDNHYVQFKLVGKETNRDAYGSKIWLYASGKSYVQEIYGGGNVYCSQNSSIVHFGLGTTDVVDSIKIEWLSDRIQVLQNLAVDSLYIVEEAVETTASQFVSSGLSEIEVFPVPFTHQFSLKTQEDFHEPVHLRLLNVNGQIVWKHTTRLKKNQSLTFHEAHLQQLSQGIYFLEITTTNIQYVLKMVKQKF